MNRSRVVFGALLLISLATASQALEPLWVYRTYLSEGYSVSVSADGSSVAAALDKIYIFNGNGEKVWGGYGGEKVVITEDGEYIAAGTNSGIVFLDRKGKTLWMDDEWNPVTEISMQGNGRYIGAIGNSVISLYSRAGTLIGRNTTLPARSLAVSPNGSMMVVGTPTGILGLNRKGGEKWSFEAFENRRVLFFPDGNLVAAASSYSVLVFDPAGYLSWEYRTASTLADVAVSSNNAYIAAGSHDKKVYLLDRGGRLIWSREVGDPVGCVAISGDGSFIAAGSVSGNDKTLYLFDKSGDLAGTYKMEAWVMGVSLSSDGSYLAAVSNDGNLYYFRNTPNASIPIATTLTAPVMTTMADQAATTPAVPPTPFLPGITPSPATSIVMVDSIPGGAEVYVDHRYSGTTPLTLGGLARGTHRIALIRTGYEDWTSDFELSDQENVTVSAVLIPYPLKTETRPQLFTVMFAFCTAVLIFSRWWNR